MQPLRCSLGLATALFLASPTAAQIAGAWAVSGAISGNAFALDCQFTPNAGGFGGICTETTPGGAGKSHVLTQGSITGSQVRWSYPAHYLFLTFAVNFTGTLSGARITGTVTASGRNGAFTAARK